MNMPVSGTVRTRRDNASAPREVPLYSAADVAHYLSLPRATVRSWVLGQAGFRPVICVADQRRRLLSFRNLVEIYVLSALLRRHGVWLPRVRKAVRYVQNRFGVEHPLSDRQFLTDGHSVFIEQYGKLISASEAGQLAMRTVISQYLTRLELDPEGTPVRLFPFITNRLNDARRSVVIDPEVVFGQPCITDTRIPTAIIAERYKAGEMIAELAADYGCEAPKIEDALRYEFPGRAA
jgi:uncharacterized protein (DUF433 family)